MYHAWSEWMYSASSYKGAMRHCIMRERTRRPRNVAERSKWTWQIIVMHGQHSDQFKCRLLPSSMKNTFKIPHEICSGNQSTWFDGRGDCCHQNGFIHEHKNVTEMGLTHAVHAFNFLSTVLVSFWHIFVTKRIITASTSQFLSTLSWRIAIFKISN